MASFLSSFCCQEDQISGAPFQHFLQVNGIYFLVHLCPRNHEFRVAYLQKKIQDCGLIFPLILLPRSPNFGGHFSTFFPSQRDDFSVLLCPRNHGFSVAYLQKKIQAGDIIWGLPLLLRSQNHWSIYIY